MDCVNSHSDPFCSSRFGHNLGLHHASQGTNEYGDQTGVMGSSYSQNEGPLMCFNAAKSWELGWYDEYQKTVSPRSGAGSALLVGVEDFRGVGTLDGYTVVLKIDTSASSDLYVMYNRQEGVNSGTKEFQNQVTVVSQDAPGDFSYVLAALSDTGRFEIPNFDSSGFNLVVEVCSIDFGTPDTAELSVFLDNGVFESTCFAATLVPTAAPSVAPTPAVTVTTASPTVAPTPAVTVTTAPPTVAPTPEVTVTTASPTETVVTQSPTETVVTQSPTVTTPVAPTPAPSLSPTHSPSDCSEGREACVSNGECCSGRCRRNRCTPSPAPAPSPVGDCSERNEACAADAECCSGTCRRNNRCS